MRLPVSSPPTATAPSNISTPRSPSGSASTLPTSPSGQLKLAEIMSADSAALIARAGRGAAHGDTRRFDIDLVKADGTSFRCASCIACRAMAAIGGLAHALVLSRAPGERGRGRAPPSSDLRACSTRRRSPSPRSMREGLISATNAAFVRLFGARRRWRASPQGDAAQTWPTPRAAEALAPRARCRARRPRPDRAGRHRL